MEVFRGALRLRADLADEHRRLAQRARQTSAASIEALLSLGSAVVLHGMLEQLVLLPQHPWLDVGAAAELRDEHRRLAEDLALLESLWLAEPGSSDVAALSDALLARLQDHLGRDERRYYQTFGSDPAAAPVEPHEPGSAA